MQLHEQVECVQAGPMYLPCALLAMSNAKLGLNHQVRLHQAQQMGKPSRANHDSSPGRIAELTCRLPQSPWPAPAQWPAPQAAPRTLACCAPVKAQRRPSTL